jgi:hypothetical protein
MPKPAAARSNRETATKKNGVVQIVSRFDPVLGKANGFTVTYYRVEAPSEGPGPRQVSSAMELLKLLESLGVELSLPSVRGALAELYARGSASIPEVWLSEQELHRHSLS